jgi:gliding motility-associated-like protein
MYSKALLHLLFLWMSIPLLAQNPCWGPNLVPNPSFEGYYSCPENKSIQRSITGWDDFSINMAQFPPSMDYFNLDCKKKVGLYAEIPQDNPPRTGTGMLGGFQFRFQAYTVIWDTTGRLLKEYAYCKLSAPLQVGKTYHLQFYTKYAISRQFRNGSIDQIGAVLSENNPLNFFANSKYRGPAPIAQRSAGQHLKDSSTWVPVSRTFVADKPYIYLTLGHFYDYDLATIQNFFKGTNSYNAYYLFDDVSLQEVIEPEPWESIVEDRVCSYQDTGRFVKKLDCLGVLITHRVYSPYPDTTLINSQTFIAADTGVFIRRLRTPSGCDSIVIRRVSYLAPPASLDSLARLYVPNVFSPNGDGINDHFVIFTNPIGLTIKQLAIYNHWGQRVYNLENFEAGNNNYFGWDGTFPPQYLAPQGTYVWVLSYQDLDGEVKIKRGTVALLR